MTGVAIGVGVAGAAVSVGASAGAAASAKSGANKAAKAQTAANKDAQQTLFDYMNKSNAALQSGYNRIQPIQQNALNASLGYQDPYATAGQNALAALMGQIAPRAAQPASGTLPDEAARIQSAYSAAVSNVEQAQRKLDEIKAKGQGLSYSPQTAGIIIQLQREGNAATVELQQAQNEARQAEQALQAVVPYQAAQDEVFAQDAPFSQQFSGQEYANDPTTFGEAPPNLSENFDQNAWLARQGTTQKYASDFSQGNNDITGQQIKDYLAGNQGASDSQILDAMKQYGVSAQQMSEATGISINEIQNRIKSANVRGLTEQDLTNNFDQKSWLANQGKTEQDLTKNFSPTDYLSSIGKTQNDLTGNFDSAAFLAKGGKNEGDLFRNFTMSDYQADPGYQFRLDQGNKAINNSAAARGGLLSGATMKAIADYNSGAASQEYGAAQGRFTGNQVLAQNAQNTAFNQFGQNRDNLSENVNTNADLFNQNRQNLQGEAINAYNQFGANRSNLQGERINAFNMFNSDRDNASKVYGDAYSRWNDQNQTIFNRLLNLSGQGQNSANQMGGYQQNYGSNMQNANQNLSTGIANNYSNYGSTNAGILSGIGQIESDKQMQIANANGSMIQGIGNAVNNGITSGAGAYLYGQGTGSGSSGYGYSGLTNANNNYGGSTTGNLNNSIDSAFTDYLRKNGNLR